MSKIVYQFTDDSYWFSNGCDCCQDTFMEAYNSEDTDPMLGTAHGVEDCWVHAILTEEGVLNIKFDDAKQYWAMSLDELKQVAEKCGIEIYIEFQEDF